MSSHFYEVALFGEFFSRDLKAILNRITLHSESSQPMHSREIVFEPLNAQQQRDAGSEPVLIRAKKELLDPESGWCVLPVDGGLLFSTFTLKGCCIRTSSQSPSALTQRRLFGHGLLAR
jgi:hypothetical protein